MVLSNIKYTDILFRCNSDDIEKLVYTQENNSLSNTCDVGVVFGGISMIPHRVNEALNLYREGLIKKILVTGGIGYLNFDRKTPEAVKLEAYLKQRNVPASDIIVEPNSRNSYENTVNSLELLQQGYNLDDTSIALITSDFHLRRCIAFFEKYVKNKELFGVGVSDGITDIDNWKNSINGRRLILQEALLLCYFAKNDKMADIEIENLNFSRNRIN